MPPEDKSSVQQPKYDFCKENTDNFVGDITSLCDRQISVYSEDVFTEFVGEIKDKIDDNFLVEEGGSKKSRRNALVNPWITPGIIVSIEKKYAYHKEWKKSKSKKNKTGNHALHIVEGHTSQTTCFKKIF